jgi:hypothetical protein
MNLKEVKQPSDQKLFEEIDRDNDTGFLTEDLVKIARAKDGKWQRHTFEELQDHMRNLLGENS